MVDMPASRNSRNLTQTLHQRLNIGEEEILGFCNRWQIAELSVFGSVLRADFTDNSDIDLMVAFQPGAAWSLLDWVQMRDELHAMLGRRVDILEKRALRNPFRRHAILNSAQVIYAA
jgi:predicted nucleotidyltransferase